MSDEYKGYSVQSNNFCNKVIKPIGKGSVPMVLRGLYTSFATAKAAIDAEEGNSKKGVKNNGTTKNSNRAI